MNETMLTVVGNLTEAPELRYLPSGAARAGFTVASLRFATAHPQRASAGGRDGTEDAAGAEHSDSEANGDGAGGARERVSGDG